MVVEVWSYSVTRRGIGLSTRYKRAQDGILVQKSEAIIYRMLALENDDNDSLLTFTNIFSKWNFWIQ
jgi:hypothetical protein